MVPVWGAIRAHRHPPSIPGDQTDETVGGKAGAPTAKYILPLRNLRELSLSNTAVGDEGVSSLRALERIEILELSSTNISDMAVESISQMRRLAELSIAGTNVSDTGLKKLEERDSLRTLVLSAFTFSGGNPGKVSCRVSPQGIAEFKRNVPRCELRF